MGKSIAKLSCINPTEYEPWELEAYADGEDMPRIKSHIARCFSCQTQLQRNQYFDSGLTASFYRFDCPSLDILCNYHYGDVSEPERASIELHLQFCPLCAKECQQFLNFDQFENSDLIHDEPDSLINKLTETVEGVSQNIRVVIASLITPQSIAAATPVFRGEQQEAQLLFTADETMISLSLNSIPNKTYEISGQVLSPSASGKDARFRLVSEEREFTGIINAGGVFNIKDAQEGHYQLTLYMVSQTIMIPNLQI